MSTRQKSTKVLLLIIISILCGLMLFRFFAIKNLKTGPSFKGKRGVEKIAVKAAPVKREDMNLILYYVGSLKARDEINVYSKVAGKFVEYTVGEGDSVEKGQTIAFLDRDETGLKYELAKVETPLSGIVARTFLDMGANVLPSSGTVGGTIVAMVVNMDEITVRINVGEPDIPYIKKGLRAEARVDSYPEEDFAGEVSKVSEVVEPQTRTLPIEIIIPNKDHRLKSGMFARIRIFASVLKDRCVVPQDALVQEVGAKYVFVVENNAASKKRVTAGIQEDSRIEILEGLNEGDNVITFGHQGLKDGTPVEVRAE